jgi:hypothetical protein
MKPNISKFSPVKYMRRALILGLVLFTLPAFSQYNTNAHYKTAIGLRAGGPSALTIKHFMGPTLAMDGILSVWNNGMRVQVLAEKHVNALDVPGLHWYFGAGPQVSFYDERYWYNNGRDRYYRYEDDQFGLGVCGVVGLEYKAPPIPVAFSLDLIPTVEFVSDGDMWTDFNPGIGMKFTF